jgi:transposase
MRTPISLPHNIDALQAMVLEYHAREQAREQEITALRAQRDALKQGQRDDSDKIARLELLLAKLQRLLFGQRSEKLQHQVDQLQLELEDLYITRAEHAAPAVDSLPRLERQAPVRRPLPEHLPREVLVHVPAETACPDCGGAWKRLGEDVSEMLEFVPASLRVIRHVRPWLTCSCCERMAQAPAPSRPIPRGLAGPGLLAHIYVSKYADHQPLYRQSIILAREGVQLSESTLADWVGAGHRLLAPLIAALRDHVFAARKLHTDDTPISVLAPGQGKTRQARLWTYVRDDRPHAGSAAPAVWFRYSADRKGIHPQTHLKDFHGTLQADAYAGYNAIFSTGRVIEAGCWAHARRHFYDIHIDRPTPITTHVLDQIAHLYRIEASIRGSPPEHRRQVRQEQAVPIVTALHAWLTEQLSTLSRKSATAEAIGYAMNQWQALTRYLDDGAVEIDNSAAERSVRGIACGRKNYLFLCSDRGGERAATMYSLMETAKLNGIDPEAYLRRVLAVIADHPINRIAELLPWNLSAEA